MDTHFMTIEIVRKKKQIERWRSKIVEEQNKKNPDTKLIESYIRFIDDLLCDVDNYQDMKNRLNKNFT